MGIKTDIEQYSRQLPNRGYKPGHGSSDMSCLAEARKDNAALMVAHHAQDQLETIAMRLQAGSGLSGLRGMQMVNLLNDMTVIRPFLDWSPQTLHEILARIISLLLKTHLIAMKILNGLL